MKHTLILVVPLLLTFFTSCKKDGVTTTKTDLLAGGSTNGKAWHVTEQVLAGNPVTIDDCILDDVTTFFQYNTYLFNDGNIMCNANDPKSYSGTWTLTEKESHLVISGNGITTDYTILELSESRMILGFSVYGVNARTTYEPL